METIIILLTALLPIAILVYYIYNKDKKSPEPTGLLVKAFIFGVLSVPVSFFMSVPLVFLTGISYPLELMPAHWKVFHYIIPVAPATMAFVKLECMGADMTNIRPEMITLWIQCVVYFIIAVLVWRKRINRKHIKKPLKRFLNRKKTTKKRFSVQGLS